MQIVTYSPKRFYELLRLKELSDIFGAKTMLKSDIIRRYPWYEQEKYQAEVFSIATRLNMDLRDVLETLDKMLGKQREPGKRKSKPQPSAEAA